MERLSFHLQVFDGPLDLLLHLISKNKVNIYDIPISDILEQYLDYIAQMEANNIELTSEFTAMAAQLLYIKSKMLLPVYETDEDSTEDPRAKLVESLLEYQRIKSVSGIFEKLEENGRDIFVKSAEPVKPLKEYIYHHCVDDLILALASMRERSGRKIPPPLSAFGGIIGHEVASVSQRIDIIINALALNSGVSFRDFLMNCHSRSEIVASFLAVLELLKDNRIAFSECGNDLILSLAVLMPAEAAK